MHTAAQPALGALEYSTSDMFGYFSHHDWYHVVDSEEFKPKGDAVKVTTSTASRANSVAKLDALLRKLGLERLSKTFRERGISYRGIVNMTPQHFKALGISKEDRTRIISALRFAKTLEPVSRQTVLSVIDGKESKTSTVGKIFRRSRWCPSHCKGNALGTWCPRVATTLTIEALCLDKTQQRSWAGVITLRSATEIKWPPCYGRAHCVQSRDRTIILSTLKGITFGTRA